jgi:hypothetical protein
VFRAAAQHITEQLWYGIAHDQVYDARGRLFLAVQAMVDAAFENRVGEWCASCSSPPIAYLF